MIQAFYMDRCHFCPSPESSKVICRSIQRKVKDFFSFFTCLMSGIRVENSCSHGEGNIKWQSRNVLNVMFKELKISYHKIAKKKPTMVICGSMLFIAKIAVMCMGFLQ